MLWLGNVCINLLDQDSSSGIKSFSLNDALGKVFVMPTFKNGLGEIHIEEKHVEKVCGSLS